MKMTRFLLERFIHNAGQLWKYVKGVPLFDLIKGIQIGYLFGQNGTKIAVTLQGGTPLIKRCRVTLPGN